MKVAHILHLYHRIGFGITPKEISRLQHKTKKQVVQELFLSSKKVTPLTIDTSFTNNIVWKDLKKDKKKRKELMKMSRQKVKEYNAVWLNRIFHPKELLREKMTLFWANHFVCEDKNILYVEQYNNILREHALGNFRDFVKAVSKEAAMLKYLNNKQNRKNSPNENFARELLELFTLGQGNYTEQDIKESARAFTGYNHDFKGNFRLRKKQHDFGEKMFLGQSGYFDGNDIIDIILREKQCARFICKKIYSYFVNDVINEEHLNEITTVFYTDYNIENLMKHILLADWFYDEKNIGSKIKSPIELLAGIYQIVPFRIEQPKKALLIQRLLGQTLLAPPNVAGWKQGKGWIDTNTIVTRLRLPSVLLNNAEINYSEKGDFKDVIQNFNKKLRKKTFIKTSTQWEVFDKNYQNTNNKELATHLLLSPISDGTKELIEHNLSGSKKEFCVQLLSLPEYQLC